MALACGRVVGMALKTAVVPAEFTAAGLSDATPEVAATLFCMLLSRLLFADADCLGSTTTTVSGPLDPTPKPCVMRS